MTLLFEILFIKFLNNIFNFFKLRKINGRKINDIKYKYIYLNIFDMIYFLFILRSCGLTINT
jgi:hypothetical protein